ncbi:MAG: SPOR domain-containing protein [Alphaproteobacteria bacterium]
MADLEFDEFEGDYGTPSYGAHDPRLGMAKRLVNLTGAFCSVALVMGLGHWGYQLAVRDVTGVPVMRALVGPMRVAPTDPGGDQASHQGLSVNAIAATGTAAPLSDQLTLAPRATELQPGDSAGLMAATGSDEDAATVLQASLQITGTATSGTPASLQVDAPAPIQDGAVSPVDATTGATADPLQAEAASVAAVATSLRPKPRPSGLSRTGAGGKPSKVQTVSASTTEIDPATLQIGTRLAQLGTFDSPEQARARFADLRAQYGKVMAGKAMVIQAATSGGHTFFRLRAHGFEGDDDSRRFCAVLEADDIDCIPTAQR